MGQLHQRVQRWTRINIKTRYPTTKLSSFLFNHYVECFGKLKLEKIWRWSVSFESVFIFQRKLPYLYITISANGNSKIKIYQIIVYGSLFLKCKKKVLEILLSILFPKVTIDFIVGFMYKFQKHLMEQSLEGIFLLVKS